MIRIPKLVALALNTVLVGLSLQSCSQLSNIGKDRKDQEFEEYSSPLYTRDFRNKLAQVGELSLEQLPSKNCQAVYRLVMIPPFNGPTIVRVEHYKDGSTSAVAKIEKVTLKPVKKFEILRRDFIWTPSQYEKFTADIKAMKFWTSPYSLKIHEGSLFADGNTWIFEGIADGQSHAIVRRPATFDDSSLKPFANSLLRQVGFLTKGTMYRQKDSQESKSPDFCGVMIDEGTPK